MAIQTLNVTKSGNGRGTVTSDVGGIDCGSVCSTSQVSGSTVTLTASPARGSVFVGWSGDLVSTSNPASYVQTLNPTNINAEFRKAKRARVKGAMPPQNNIYFNPSVFPSGIPNTLPYNGSTYNYSGTVNNAIGEALIQFTQASTVKKGSQMVEMIEGPVQGSSQRVSGGGSGKAGAL